MQRIKTWKVNRNYKKARVMKILHKLKRKILAQKTLYNDDSQLIRRKPQL